MKIDGAKLTQIIQTCFDLSMDGRLTPKQQTAFRTEGKRLRGLLMNILTAEFDKATPQFQAASQALTETNQSIKKATKDLDQIAAVLKKLTVLTKALDKLLGVAVSFV